MPDREKVIERLQRVSCYFKSMLKVGYDGDAEIYREHRESIKMAIELLKEQESKTGHWIDTTKVIGFPRVQCSVCGSGQGAIWMDHCPNCGAKMEGGDV